jgi:hypothetical protein
MLSRLFPKTIDNAYRGPWAAVWLLALVVLMKLSTCFGTILATRRVALGPDGVPVDRVSPEIAGVMLQMLALIGLDQLVLTLVAVIALIRYRAMIPLAFLLLLTEQLGRRLIHMTHPAVHGQGATVGVYINLAILALMVVGLVLSLTERRTAPANVRRAF